MESFYITTPEQVRIRFELAGIGSRFLAAALDILIQTLSFLALYFLSAVIFREINDVLAVLIIAAFLLFFAYYIFFEWLLDGKTIGKFALGIRVVKSNGAPLDFPAALLRNLFRLLDFMPSLYGVGFLFMFFSHRSQRLGDIVASTVVVLDRVRIKKPSTASRPEPPQETPPEARAPVPASGLSKEEYQLVKSFFDRHDSLPPKARAALAENIARIFYGRFQIAERGKDDPVKFLRALLESRGV